MPMANGGIRRCRKHLDHNNADRPYFVYHRDNAGQSCASANRSSRASPGGPTILLSKRISKQDGSFAGVLTAAIDSDYFNNFYRTFQLGPDGGISLLRSDGARSDSLADVGQKQQSFQDGPVHQTSQAQLGRILQDRLAVRWHHQILRLRGNVAISAGRDGGDVRGLAAVELAGGAAHRRPGGGRVAVHDHPARRPAVVPVQLPHQDRAGARGRARRTIACSPTTSPTSSSCSTAAACFATCPNRSNRCWAFAPDELVGKSCFDLVHAEDKEAVMAASARLSGSGAASATVFRTRRGDGSYAWVESNFKQASQSDKPAARGIRRRAARRHRTQADGG